jgi:prepilin-type N-terminal cleavage/methylation domain-containing protein
MTPRERSSQAGFTLVEVLLAMSLMLIVFAASLGVFAVMERGASRNQSLNESQQQARTATDQLARGLRNLASPYDSADPLEQQPLELAEAHDLVYRTVSTEGAPTTGNPQNLERVRFCLGPDRVLYRQRQTWTGAMPARPADTACPGAGWTETRTTAANVVNGARPVFSYQGSPVPGTYSELTSVAPADFPTAIALRTTLYLDPDTAHAPRESTLTTRVFLRNQNRPPTASFTATAAGRKITLNASQSDDPEGNRLTYQWFDNGAPMTDPATGAELAPSPNAIYSFNASPGSHALSVKVFDAGRLSDVDGPKTTSCDADACTSPS